MTTTLRRTLVEHRDIVLFGLMSLMILAAVLMPLASVFAQDIPDIRFKTGVTDPKTEIKDIVRRVANIAGTAILAISVLMILWAAFKFLTAQGDPTAITSARGTLIFALVGVAVALLAFALPVVINNLFP